jgi:hypothetical protein
VDLKIAFHGRPASSVRLHSELTSDLARAQRELSKRSTIRRIGDRRPGAVLSPIVGRNLLLRRP